MVIAMARSRPTRDAGIRRRPKDRKAQIARASAEAFSTLGYHAVSMEAIASRVGISATALYRHYPSKYDLFRDAVLRSASSWWTARRSPTRRRPTRTRCSG